MNPFCGKQNRHNNVKMGVLNNSKKFAKPQNRSSWVQGPNPDGRIVKKIQFSSDQKIYLSLIHTSIRTMKTTNSASHQKIQIL